MEDVDYDPLTRGNPYIPEVDLEELLNEWMFIPPTLKEVEAEQVIPVPDDYTEKSFIKLLGDPLKMANENNWIKVYRYFSTSSKFEYASVGEIMQYFCDITSCKIEKNEISRNRRRRICKGSYSRDYPLARANNFQKANILHKSHSKRH